MESVFQVALLNDTLGSLADGWRVTPEAARNRVRKLPFLVLVPGEGRGGGRGRPHRRVALNPTWRFPKNAGKRPLSFLLDCLQALHEVGEPFALGAPVTSGLWRSFLNPEVRLYAPPETLSAWKRLFEGEVRGLRVRVEPLAEGVPVTEMETLPVLAPEAAVVDAVAAWDRTPNDNLLALADALGHRDLRPEVVLGLASLVGLQGDVSLLLHRARNRDGRVLTADDARAAHETAKTLGAMPPVAFRELVESREAYAR